MPPLKDLRNQRFGQLTALEPIGRNRWGGVIWRCRCDCGMEKPVAAVNLGTSSRSCGCSRKKARGPETPSLYWLWADMIRRCRNPQHPHYHLHGAKGVTVCDRWASSFQAFQEDMPPRPHSGPKRVLSRIDPTKGYEPGNCRWATYQEHWHNAQNARLLTHNGKTQTMSIWAEELGITVSALSRRLSRGMTVEQALRPRLKGANKEHP